MLGSHINLFKLRNFVIVSASRLSKIRNNILYVGNMS